MTEKFFIELSVSDYGNMNEILCSLEHRGRIRATAVNAQLIHEHNTVDVSRHLRSHSIERITGPVTVVLNLEMNIDVSQPRTQWEELDAAFAEITQPQEEQNDMNAGSNKEWNATALLVEGLITIAVAFNNRGGKHYTYMTLDDTIEEGDFVVVPSANDDPDFPLNSIGIVKLVHKRPQIDINSNYRYKWVVQRVDTREWDDMMARMEEFANELGDLNHKATVRQMLELLTVDVGDDHVNDALARLNGLPTCIEHEGQDEDDVAPRSQANEPDPLEHGNMSRQKQ